MDSTNLKKTYMYGKFTNNENFYKKYKNDENSIDDPIFTGFTFDIDTIHSPLFSIGESYESLATDTLRATENGKVDLANAIEKRMTEVYNNSVIGNPEGYGLNTLSTKDKIDGNSHYVGYGLQDRTYLDEVSYGATDYIYMVDKVSIGTYSDEIDKTTNVGNGTPVSSVYDVYKSALSTTNPQKTDASNTTDSNGNQIVNSIDLITGEDIDSKINSLESSIDKASKDEHTANESERDRLQKEYNEIYNDSSEGAKDGYMSLQEQLNNIKQTIEKETADVKTKLADFQSKSQIYYKRLQSSLDVESSDAKELNTLYSEYENFYNSISTNYPNVKVNISSKTDNQKTSKQEESLTDEEKKKGENLLAIYKKVWEIENTKISSVTNSSNSEKSIKDLGSKIKEKEKRLYGEGRSMYNASSESLYGQKKMAENKCANDKYSQTQQQIDTLKDAKGKLDEINSYNNYNSSKSTITSYLEPLPSMDPKGENETFDSYNQRVAAYQTDTEKLRNVRDIYEAPQTVYDMLGFITGMKKLTYEYPYVMQTVTGLEEAYKKYFNLKEPYQGSGDDKITINCYESLDLRVSSMFNKYFNAVYDHQYKRERVPINLRRFQCSVFVHDIRNFRHSLNGLMEDNRFKEMKDGDNIKSKIVELALNYMSTIEFKFYDCEIVPEETGTIFDSVSNETGGDMKKTNFTFTYGNCVVNFLPFEDLKKYYEPSSTGTEKNFTNKWVSEKDENKKDDDQVIDKNYSKDYTLETQTQIEKSLLGDYNDSKGNITDNNFRRWFDKSSLGNVNNNDYRDYIRHSSSVEVDDAYKTSIVNNFALNSVVNKNQQLTEMDDALRKIVVGISASTGIPVKGVVDSLNIGNIYKYINKGDGSDMPVIRDLGNVTNSRVVDEKTMEYKGEVIEDNKSKELDIVSDLGKISTEKGW